VQIGSLRRSDIIASPVENQAEADEENDASADIDAEESSSVAKGILKDMGRKYELLHDRYCLFFDSPASELDTPTAKAYVVKDTKRAGRRLFALLCDPKFMPRSSLINSLRGMNNKGLMPYVDSGVVYCPNIKKKAMAFIYERPMGGKLVDVFGRNENSITENEFVNKYARQLFTGLQELVSRGVTHRSIRPDNIFFMDEARNAIVLGDCLAGPPAYSQPGFCETIESMMCLPEARGAGDFSNDIYSLGATIAFLVAGNEEFERLSEDEILEEKVKKGSFNLMVGGEKVSLQMVELLKGMLADHTPQRWDAASLELWLAGKRLSHVNTVSEQRAQRSLVFCGKEYFTKKALSYAMWKNWDKAYEIIENGKLEVWVRRGFEDEVLANALLNVISFVADRTPNKKEQRDIAVSRSLSLLDPSAPIRTQTASVYPDGLGSVLYNYLYSNKDTTNVAQIIKFAMVIDWLDAKDRHKQVPAALQIKSHLMNQKKGYGIERVLYELIPDAPCVSPMVADEYVDNYRLLLPALDAAAKKVDMKNNPIDRHVAAFLLARNEKKLKSNIEMVASSNSSISTAGLLKLLADLQWNHGPEKLYALTSWVGGLMSPVIKSYHSRQTQKKMEKEMPKIVRQGSLSGLYSYLDNHDSRVEDDRGFKKAKVEYRSCSDELADLETNKALREKEALLFGEQMAAVVAVFMMVLTAVIWVLAKVM